MGLEGLCFAAIDSRSGTPNIPLGLNKMILGLVLAAWVLMDSVLLQANTKHAVGAQRDESGPVVGDMGLCDVLKTQPKWSLSGVQAQEHVPTEAEDVSITGNRRTKDQECASFPKKNWESPILDH